MEIKIEKGDVKLEWKTKGRNKTRTLKNKKGVQKAFQGVIVKIPYELIQLISNNGTHTYLYEHFEKIAITPHKPPKDTTYHKSRLNKTSNNMQSNAIIEIPSKFFNTAMMKYAVFTYYPNKKDYLTNNDGLILLETSGENPRKHLKQISTDKNTITYPTYIYQTQVLEGIYMHEDLTQILDPQEFYIYIHNGMICVSNTQPPIECIHTTENDLIMDLIHHHLINDYTEELIFSLIINRTDVFNKEQPLITLESKDAIQKVDGDL